MTKLEKTIAALRQDAEVCRPKEEAPAPVPPAEVEPETDPADEPVEIPEMQPTVRDFATALYMMRQNRTCRNCIRREHNNCNITNPRPKQCRSFRLNSRQMATYGQQARIAIRAWYVAISLVSGEAFNTELFTFNAPCTTPKSPAQAATGHSPAPRATTTSGTNTCSAMERERASTSSTPTPVEE